MKGRDWSSSMVNPRVRSQAGFSRLVAEDAEHVDGVHEVGILGGNGHMDVEAQRGELPSEGFGNGRIVLQDEELPLRARHWVAVASWV